MIVNDFVAFDTKIAKRGSNDPIPLGFLENSLNEMNYNFP